METWTDDDQKRLTSALDEATEALRISIFLAGQVHSGAFEEEARTQAHERSMKAAIALRPLASKALRCYCP